MAAIAEEAAAPVAEGLLSRIGLGRLGGVLKDFNDNPVGKILGSSFGRTVAGHVAGSEVSHVLGGATAPMGPNQPAGTGGVNIGPMGNI